MKVSKAKCPSRASTIITTEIDDMEMLDKFQSVEVFRQMVDKSSDKLLEEFMPELRTKFVEEMERITKQMGQEVMVKGLKSLAKE
jgi:hypothetical protein